MVWSKGKMKHSYTYRLKLVGPNSTHAFQYHCDFPADFRNIEIWMPVLHANWDGPAISARYVEPFNEIGPTTINGVTMPSEHFLEYKCADQEEFVGVLPALRKSGWTPWTKPWPAV